MAEAPTDSCRTDLKQRILQALKDAGSPVKTAQLAKQCQVIKKTLNRVLYQMERESQVAPAGPATWQLVKCEPGRPVCKALALPSNAESPRQDAAVVPPRPGCQLSEQEEKILKFLEATGPCKAVVIARYLGKKTAKEVNPDLYALKDKHFLSLDQNSKAWAIYQPEAPKERRQPTRTIYQQNAINFICQNGPDSRICIKNAEAVQIGHGNRFVRQAAPGDDTAPADPSTEDSLAESWGSQDIRVENSVLKRVQLGHGNEMGLRGTLAQGPDRSLSVSPPVSTTTAHPEASFEIRTPAPGAEAEEAGEAGVDTQRVRIKSCLLEDAVIGHGNRMLVHPQAAGAGRGPGPEDRSGDAGEPSGAPVGHAAPQSEAAEPRDASPQDSDGADPCVATLSDRLGAMLLDSRDPEAAGDSPQGE